MYKKLKFYFPLFFLIFIFSLALIFSPISIEQIARAVTGNYSRNSAVPADTQLTLDDWNYLDEDFLLRDGSNNMQGNLNMNNHRITNLGAPAYPAAASEMQQGANLQYVNDAIAGAAAAGGGEIFTNWGSAVCPVNTNLIYSGYGFSAPYNKNAGGSNVICVQTSATPSFNNPSATADAMLPLVTGPNATMPNNTVDPSSSIAGQTLVRCAICYNPGGECYTNYGDNTCAAGFNNNTDGYRGYVLGSFTSNATDSHSNPTSRECVNINFDNSSSAGANMGAMWYGSTIISNFGLGYTTNTFIKCAQCCQ